ncbi:transporter substrate-binding domain-containing protein [Poseidonibacter lekithochrous]|uniref:transporter substrate-binding domain-containing protein n=1 Tax=Poseidonibacter TaxID=2321187 RepID=UPI001C08BDE5|nr:MULTISPECIES: transporter substrate-binding domain-containing protein [Poseidonibacter]MBU3015010.1 transporter substrate-binding domain-containing protein [Poseidonibacter lekithochrous]MDO6828307.1 transporter substrate-binding domain-containing protein [Poseidonibacter sp. 1_MG-2023]
MKKINMLTFYVLIILIPTFIIASPITLIYHAEDNEVDARKHYEIELLSLALDKTKDKYGEYKLIPSKKMTITRAVYNLKENKIKNFILKTSVDNTLLNKFSFSNFPVDRGIVGYRVSFISPQMKEKIHNIKSLEELKTLKFAQGVGWLDTNILKSNGFNVRIIANYSSFFHMITLNRIDLFPRGINEVLAEYEAYKHLDKLDYDRTFALYYPLPRFFFMNKKNEKIAKRIEEGLKIGFYDGSIDKLFEKYYQPSINFINMKQRKIYKIDNPFLKGIDKSYEKYNYPFLIK